MAERAPAVTEKPAAYPRADITLVERQLFSSRAKAQEAIAAGLVRADGEIIRKPSEPIKPGAKIEATPAYPWVSRGGVKLAAALDAFGLDPAGRLCLDVGASTGGFTHVLLARGAAEVVCVDVGHGQLHPYIAHDPRVLSREGIDARNLTQAQFTRPPALVTCDVSFISLALVLPSVLPLTAAPASLVALIKPQFEAGPGGAVKGIVKENAIRLEACKKIERLVKSLGWRILGVLPSPIEGGDGNQEFLLGAIRE
ncbi:MAG TPA: TlyA family RNA methyltransferase [Methylocella sp.]|nr:TlyA family RNA methyltransferase [Methylocella sp.]